MERNDLLGKISTRSGVLWMFTAEWALGRDIEWCLFVWWGPNGAEAIKHCYIPTNFIFWVGGSQARSRLTWLKIYWRNFLYYLFREGWGEWCSFTVSDLYQRSIFEREYINFLYPVSPTGPPFCSSIASCHLYFAPSAGRRQSGWRQKWAARRCGGGVRFPDRMS